MHAHRPEPSDAVARAAGAVRHARLACRHSTLTLAGAIAALMLVWPAGAKEPMPTPAAAAPATQSAAVGGEAVIAALDASRVERISWGATPALLAEVKRTGFDAWLQGQLRPGAATLPAPVLARIDAMELSRVPFAERVASVAAVRKEVRTGGSAGDEKKMAQKAYKAELRVDGREAASRSLLMAIHSPNQLQEQMTWFWMNHFSIGADKRNIDVMIGDYENAIRAKALTKFRDVLDASVFHPAMLRYLDNDRNVAGKINENYARELLELHTLGVDGGYGQPDVQEVAKVLTGLGIGDTETKIGRKKMVQSAASWRQGLVEFDPSKNEPGNRVVLGKPVVGKGIDGIREVLDRLARHPSTARYVSFKIAQFFVADAPPEALVATLKAKFLATDGDIPALLETLFRSKEFEASLGHKFKDPQHFVVSAVRLAANDRPVINVAPALQWLNRLGQPTYGRKTPDGWPLTEAAWAGSGQMNIRFEVANLIGEDESSLFRADDPAGDKASDRASEKAAERRGADRVPPKIDNVVWRTAYVPRLSEATRTVLAEARSGPVDDWNALALSSPEFNHR